MVRVLDVLFGVLWEKKVRRLEKSTLLPVVAVMTNVRYGWPFLHAWKIDRELLIRVRASWAGFDEMVLLAGSVKILVQWLAGHRRVCTRDHPPPSLFCLRWILTILIPRTSWSTQCRANSRPRISKPSTTLSMWRLATGVSSIFFSLSCFGSTFSQCGISQFQINPSLISCSTPIFVLSP